jgi:hypothetical protein
MQGYAKTCQGAANCSPESFGLEVAGMAETDAAIRGLVSLPGCYLRSGALLDVEVEVVSGRAERASLEEPKNCGA